AKLKVKGIGFNPMLRAYIGGTPALGFVFETPNSADVLVGVVKPDEHDLILFDGVQEVARATGVYTQAQPAAVSSFFRGSGWLTALSIEAAGQLRVGYRFPDAAPELEIVALGAIRPARSRVNYGGTHVEMPLAGLVEREAVLTIRCEAPGPASACSMVDRLATVGFPATLTLAGPTVPFSFVLQEVIPTSAPKRARVQVRLAGGPHLSSLKVGDRDAFLDGRAAVIASIAARTPDAITVMLDIGLDDSRDGWRYRSQRVKPGVWFVMSTNRYEASGQVQSVDVHNGGAQQTR
ncbi:MAG: hypothetical protein ACRD2A_09920, partial [Vicinamibacterales bacterium]